MVISLLDAGTTHPYNEHITEHGVHVHYTHTYAEPARIKTAEAFDTEQKYESWEESHPWFSNLTQQDEDDSLDEVIRYTLDELRFA